MVLEDHVRSTTRGEDDLDFPGILPAQTGCKCSKGAQLMQKLEFSSYTLANASLWRTQTAGGQQHAGSGYCWGARRVPQQDTKADMPGSSQHPQISPVAVIKLGVACRA